MGICHTPKALKTLNDFLSDKSYIEGFVASQADVAVFEAIASAPLPTFCHLLRWYNHIKSFHGGKADLPAVNKQFVLPDTPPTSTNSDEDLDLFGSDDEGDGAEASKKPAVIKLQIGCVVEDDKVGTDQLEEAITAFEEYVQSVDVAAFNKI
uniref:Elongation factor 1-beta n=1 Tax=Hippocampus comes TaxID=109280 RepID=A0A3Q2YIW0_HIPCM